MAAKAILFLALSGVVSSSPITPVVMWSQQSDMFGSLAERTVLSDVNTRDAMDNWLKQNTDPSVELLIAFNFPSREGIKSGLKSFPNIQNHVEIAKSSIVFPFIASDLWSSQSQIEGEQYVVSSWDEALTFSSTHSEVLSNGKLDVMIIDLKNSDNFNEQFAALQSVLSTKQNQCAYALPLEHSNPASSSFVKMVPPQQQRRLDDTTSTTDPTKYVYMTPDLLAGILTGLLLVMIILIGLNCLGSIQTPSQFSDKPPPSSREY
jgi:hypothetical protein